MAKIFIISLIIMSITYCYLVGGYQKDSFESNDNPDVPKCLRLVEQELNNKAGQNVHLKITPVSLYHQLVNGINYKMILLVEEGQIKKLVEAIVYTGPFSSEEKEFSITSIRELKQNDSDLEKSAPKEGLKDSLAQVIEQNLETPNENVKEVLSVSVYSEPDADEHYVVIAEVVRRGDILTTTVDTYVLTPDLDSGHFEFVISEDEHDHVTEEPETRKVNPVEERDKFGEFLRSENFAPIF